ncbi:hypothetical protein BSKO_01122 [Bryopsis sp. KO-2023]|nr:hypothetical protein BSKO_01122 [Bryopsis sp. KO-2023]
MRSVVVTTLTLLFFSGFLEGVWATDAETVDDGLLFDEQEDLGLILYVTGVPQLKKSIMKSLCVATAKTVSSMACVTMWSDGALVKSTTENPVSALEKEKVLETLQKILSTTEGTENAKINFEQNLEVVATALHTQKNAPLNLGRLDQARNTKDNEYKYRTTGKGVTVYVLDKGINAKHVEFKHRTKGNSRVSYGTRTFRSDPSCAGHGTHVAGIVGGLKYGVAKDVNIVMVQVQPCAEKGSVQYLLSGMDWVLNNVKYPAVVQMSLLALGTSHSLNRKVKQIIDARIPFVLSAGNYANDACYYSPAMVSSAIVVGNVDSSDVINKYSNYGSCVDLFAPGTSIRSASATSDTRLVVMTGTSQSAPHVSGVVAQYLEREPWASVKDVMDQLLATATRGAVRNPKGSPNYLLQTDLSPLSQTVTASIDIPGMSVTPGVLDPVNIFQSKLPEKETVFSVSNHQGGILDYNITLDSVDGSDVESWLSVSKSSGSLEVGAEDEIIATFNSTGVPQGVYQADILIQGTDPDKPLHSIRVLMRHFCGELAEKEDEDAASTVEMLDIEITDKRPSSWGPQLPGGDPPSLYLDAKLVFNVPVVNDDPELPFPQMPQSLSMKDGGFVDFLEPVEGELCSAFHVRARAPKQDAWTGGNSVCLEVLDKRIVDIYEELVPGTELCGTYDDKPQAKLYGAYMTYSSDEGLFTDETDVEILAAFTEEVRGVNESQFYVEIDDEGDARISHISKIEGSKSFYQLTASIPEAFYGQVKVGVKNSIQDTTGQALQKATPLTFTRIRKPLVKHTSYAVRDEL